MCEGEYNSRLNEIARGENLREIFNLPEPRKSMPLSKRANNLAKEIGDMEDYKLTMGKHYKINETQKYRE